MLDIFEDLHGIVLAVEDLGHGLHMALGDALRIPKTF